MLLRKKCGNCFYPEEGVCRHWAGGEGTTEISSGAGRCENWLLNRLEMDDYQQETYRTVPDNLTSRELLGSWAMGLCGEAGEAAELIKKFLYQGHEMARERAAEELGDCLYYLSRYAAEIGYSLSEITYLNIQKRQERYPNGFTPERSLNRTAEGRDLK